MTRPSPPIEWGPQYRTGIKIIDEQHQTLFDLIRNLDTELARIPLDSDQVHKAIDAAVAYSMYHFVTEESHAYRCKATSNIEAHVATHDAFRKKLADLRGRMERGNLAIVARELLDYLKDWLTGHILHTDIALAQELLALQKGDTAAAYIDEGGLLIAVVEDNDDLREEIVFYLSHIGHRAIGCANGAALNQLMGERGCDIILLDLGLPDIDGMDLLHRHSGRRDTAIIVITARNGVGDRVAGYQQGADAYLTKPVDMRELVAVVDTLAHRLHLNENKQADSWRFSASRWVLVSPTDIAVPLTEQQAEILQLFIRAKRRVLSRQEISTALGWTANGVAPTHCNERIEAALSRLRAKMEEIGFDPTPIRTIRGIGYSFAAPLLEVA